MLSTIGRSSTGQLASVTLATSFVRSLALRPAARSRFSAPGIYKPATQAIRGLTSTATSRPKKAPATTKKPATASAKKTPTSVAKKPAAKAKATATTKGRVKPKAKATGKTKAKAKVKKARPAKKKPARKPLSEERKRMLERQSLKKLALFAEPKTRPVTTRTVFSSQGLKGVTGGRSEVTSMMTTLAREYKTLPANEMQRLKTLSDQNKLANASDYKAWTESLPVQDVYDANLARRTLKNKFDYPKGSLKLIKDDRLPKRPPQPYSLFMKARWASGEFTEIRRTEGLQGFKRISLQVSTEWKALTAAERQPYVDLAQAEHERLLKSTNNVVVPKYSRSKSP
ncbi:hypothetical protein F4808DRAFT_177492 [Astrocystis sublimbata]|nr:hypothetical protein F4808DRAFT_177492 [Astrocystis sublimbata]